MSDAAAAELPTGQLNLLVSYPYINAAVIALIGRLGDRVRWVVDSGAFTAWKSGKPIALADYCSFIERLPVRPWRYFTLDVIGDPEGTRRNYEAMRERGLSPVPIYTRGEDTARLDEYYETCDLVGFGGLVGTSASSRLQYIHTMMRSNKGRRAHLLGFTTFEHLKALRPYMCDSNNWDSYYRYGMVDIYMGFGSFKRVKKYNAHTKPDEALLARVRALGFRASELGTRANWHGGGALVRAICAASWVQASLEIERHLGTKLFLACTASSAPHVAAQYERLTAA